MISNMLMVLSASVLLPLSAAAQITNSDFSALSDDANLDAVSAGSAECNVATDQASYATGETVTLSVLALSNTSPGPGSVEWKVFLEIPGINTFGLVNLGADGSLALPPGINFDSAPFPLFTVSTGYPSGTHTLGCRVLDPVTGALLAEDLHNYDITP